MMKSFMLDLNVVKMMHFQNLGKSPIGSSFQRAQDAIYFGARKEGSNSANRSHYIVCTIDHDAGTYCQPPLVSIYMRERGIVISY